jgi:alkylation response protein AidB-like acyl-CoA dehydrogenase
MIDGSDMATVELDGVRVADEALLGKPGAALGALSAGMDATIVASAFGTVGAMEAVFIETAGQLREPFDSMFVELARSAAMLGLASLLQPDARRRAYATSATKAVVARASGVFFGQALRSCGDIGDMERVRLSQLSSFAAASNALRGSLDFHLSRMAMFM